MAEKSSKPISEKANMLSQGEQKSPDLCNDKLLVEEKAKKTYNFKVCNKEFSDSKQQYRHLRRQHVIQINTHIGDYIIRIDRDSSGNFSCPLVTCGSIKFSNIDTLNSHLDKQHGINAVIDTFETAEDDRRKRIKFESPEFDLCRGSQLALTNCAELAYNQTLAISCAPLALHMKHPSMTSSHTSHALMQKDIMLDMLGKIPFQNGNYSEVLECVVQVHRESQSSVENDATDSVMSPTKAYMEKLISSSSLPGLGGKFTFVPPTTELLDALNTDFRLCQPLLHAVAVLHTGCLIITPNNALLTLTAEAYSRAKLLDSHGETNMKSLPSFSSFAPNVLSVAIHEEADGGPAKMKLKIGSKTMNILVTMSSMIKSNKVFIGPETPIGSGSTNFPILYDKAKQKKFVSTVKTFFANSQEIYKAPMSISSLRQLSSGFGKISTYAAWRATLECLDTDLLQPATIFTIADIPSNQGYGVSDKSISKAASSILQSVATAVILERGLTIIDIKNIIEEFSLKTQQTPEIVGLLTHLKIHTTTNPLDIGTYLAPISIHAANSLSMANKKISGNVETKLLEMFGQKL